MTAEQLKRREGMLSRSDRALEKWPDRKGPEFTSEMQAVIRALETLAQEADLHSSNVLERARNWRYIGIAYFDLADAREMSLLKKSEAVFANSEALSRDLHDDIETAKLNYSYGQALFHLSASGERKLLEQAVQRYKTALAKARRAMPEGVALAQEA